MRTEHANKRNTKPDPIPESIAKQFAELYAKYNKPELFFEWLFEQEQRKRELVKQQQEFELQRQYNLARAELYKQRNRWERDLIEQFVRESD
jgi:hypothetical protein